MRFVQWSWKCDAPGCTAKIKAPPIRHYDGTTVPTILDPNEEMTIIARDPRDSRRTWKVVRHQHFCYEHTVKLMLDDKEYPL